MEDSRVQLFLDLITYIPDGWEGMKLLAAEADVTAQTLWNWKFGLTVNPHINTLTKVAIALGLDIVLQARVKARLRAVR